MQFETRDLVEAREVSESPCVEIYNRAIDFNSDYPLEAVHRAIDDVTPSPDANDGGRASGSQLRPQGSYVVPKKLKRREVALEVQDQSTRIVIDVEHNVLDA
jgi:hypothetical protein